MSEDRNISIFRPHRVATTVEEEALVWAIDTRHLPLYWFPRDCPRGTFWAAPETIDADVERFLGDRLARVHAVEPPWEERMHTTPLFAYRLPDNGFEPYEPRAATGSRARRSSRSSCKSSATSSSYTSPPESSCKSCRG